MTVNSSNAVHIGHIEAAREVFSIEIEALNSAKQVIDESFAVAVEQVLACKGRVVFCGMGKSGHIARKMFATFVSTGTPALYIHPAEAFHGDLGMVKSEDLFVMISNSGETSEVLQLLPFISQNGNKLIALTGDAKSSLALKSDIHLDIAVEREACPLNLAPTSSTTLTLVFGDALAVAVMKARGFQDRDFARFHPGGALGRRLLSTVELCCDEVVTVPSDGSFTDLLLALSSSRSGCVVVVAEKSTVGLVTFGDLSRVLKSTPPLDYPTLELKAFITTNPITIGRSVSCTDADRIMAESGVNSLLVSDGSKLIGIYHNLNKSNEE